MLRLIKKSEERERAAQLARKSYGPEALAHHQQLLEGYFQSHVTRNHSERTIAELRRHLMGWFKEYGGPERPLYVWEAMEPVTGRKRIVEYGKALIAVELDSSTIRRYLGHLRDFFSYVAARPIVFDGEASHRITELYGGVEQPVSEHDIPRHSYGGESRGIPMDPERLYDFYGVLREKHLTDPGMKDIRARDYSMAVLAGESGLRIDELIHIEISKDLFFESKKLQTRHAKGMNGSGKRSRPTLFTPLARDTIRFYLNHHRPRIRGAADSDFLFVNRGGCKMDRRSVGEQLGGMVSCAQKSGFPVMDRFSWHWFRKVFATRFIERFPDKLHVLIELLGHVTPHTVHTYIHHSEAWSDRMMRQTLEQVNTHGYSVDA